MDSHVHFLPVQGPELALEVPGGVMDVSVRVTVLNAEDSDRLLHALAVTSEWALN